MPYLPTAQAWLDQSALLLEARPTTTRITTKYTVSKPTLKARTSKTTKSEATAPTTDPAVAPETATTPAPPPNTTTRATLTLKTYNPASGVTLKYRTDKAAEVGRLVSSLARLGRSMAGLPEAKEDVAMLDAQAAEGAAAEVTSGTGTPVVEKGNPVGGGGGGGQQGGKKGKKKGKK